MELAVTTLWYLLLDAARAEWDEPLWRDSQAQLLLDLAQPARERALPASQVPGGGDVEAPRPGVFRRGAALDEQVRSLGISAVHPAVKAPVPEPPAVGLALPRDLTRRSPEAVEHVEQLVHAGRVARWLR